MDQANDLTFSPIGVERQGFDSALLESNYCDADKIVICDDEADSPSRSKNAQLQKISMNSSSFKYESNMPSLLSFRSYRESNNKIEKKINPNMDKENISLNSNQT